MTSKAGLFKTHSKWMVNLSEKMYLLRNVESASISFNSSSHIDIQCAQFSSSNFLCICNLYGCMPSVCKYFWIELYDTFSILTCFLIDIHEFSFKYTMYAMEKVILLSYFKDDGIRNSVYKLVWIYFCIVVHYYKK